MLKLLFWLYPSDRKYGNASSVAAAVVSRLSVAVFSVYFCSGESIWTRNEIHCEVLVSYFTLSLSLTDCLGSLTSIEWLRLYFAAGDRNVRSVVFGLCKFSVYVQILSITFE